MVNKPSKNIRQNDGNATEDPASIANLTYNEASGSSKQVPAGSVLKPIYLAATNSYTTDATTARSIRKGSSLYIYNNSGTAYSVTFGKDAAMVALAIGAVDANGNVGIPCKANEWTYVGSFDNNWVRTNNAALIVLVLEDETYLSSQRQ